MKPVSTELRQGDDAESVKVLKQPRRNLTSQPEYLLFLRKRKDDRYEAVSGQMDAALSVRALFHPSQVR